MASSKNVQALNSRLELSCQTRVSEFYRQHVSSLAELEHQKLDTARLLKSVRKCPSDHEALSIKFLGPPPKSGHRRRGRQQQQQLHHQPRPELHSRFQQLDDPPDEENPPQLSPRPRGVTQSARTSGREPNDDDQQQLAQIQQELQQLQQPRQQQQPPLTAENPFAPGRKEPAAPPARSKTFVAAATESVAAEQQVPPRDQSRRRRSRRRRQRSRGDCGGGARNPGLPADKKLERFYAQLAATKLGCGLPVVDATQTDEARRFRYTLTRAEWRCRLAKLDPEYFKNMVDSSSCSSCSGGEAGSDGDGEEASDRGDASESGAEEEGN